jgi:phytoene dehydrogenase-like protein
MTENTYDALIVGGGMAGLTAAAFLARAGKKILLIEKNRELGGLVNSFSRNGFHFDAGVRALEDAGIIFPMLKDLNIELEVVKSHVSLGIENEILHIENLESLHEYKNLLKKFYPESSQEIDELLKTIRKIMKHMDVLYGIENPLFKDLKRDTSFILKKLLPWLPRFLFTIGKINRMQFPVEDYLNTVIKNPSLRDIISQHFFKNTPAFFALSYFSLYLDYFYPKGGVGKLAEALRDRIIELGGEIKTGTIITGIQPANHTVVDDKNNSYTYKNLIWAADLKTLYKIAETQSLSDNIKSTFGEAKAKILANKGGESVFTLFLQLDEPLESFGKIANGHFFYTPSRKGLGNIHRKELYDLLANFEKTSKQQILDWLDKFLNLNTFEISIPGLKDKDLAPPGKTGMIISFLADYELFKKVQEAGWLEEFIPEIENRLLEIIANSVFPMLKDRVIGHFSFSPLSIQNRIGSSEGAIVGWEFQKEMPVINKIQIAGRSVFTPLPSIFQAGQWAYSPAGVPMSILTGKIAADKVIKSLSKK